MIAVITANMRSIRFIMADRHGNFPSICADGRQSPEIVRKTRSCDVGVTRRACRLVGSVPNYRRDLRLLRTGVSS